jgi:hypothetical protein
LALHWSAEVGLADVCQLLLKATTTAAAALTARVAAAAAADAAEVGDGPELAMPNLLELQVSYPRHPKGGRCQLCFCRALVC